MNQRNPKLLVIDYPFIETKSNQALDVFDTVTDMCCQDLSIYIEDLFYSLHHNLILACVQHSIDKHSSVAFQNSVGISDGDFLEYLSFY